MRISRTVLIAAALSLWSLPLFAQMYPVQHRPPETWRQLKTDHFHIVFPAGMDSSAVRAAGILETRYPEVRSLVGGNLRNFPVVLKNYNDRSNGFVTSLHFRSEIDLSPLPGKALNPRSGTWLEAVAPHELVHALQYSNTKGFLPTITYLFSPDIARSFHGAIPSGINEGIATYYENEGGLKGGGRGNHPWFTRRFRSVFDSPGRWNMGQMAHTPLYTLPFNRHYLGGYHFISWLQETYGEETTGEALDFYLRFPFLGYGTALRHVTGSWPSELHTRFVEGQEETYDSNTPSVESGDDAAPGEKSTSWINDLPYKGASTRNPQWIDDSTLVFHGTFYNGRPGYYRYRTDSHDIELLLATGSVADYHFDISENRDRLIYSWYRPSTIYNNTFTADISLYELDTGETSNLSSYRRLYSPEFAGSEILALQNEGTSNRLVSLGRSEETSETLLEPGIHRITGLAAEPEEEGRLALVLSKRGVQGLWITSREDLKRGLNARPDLVFNRGSLYDPEWHPAENRLLFSSDHSGTLQVYEYNLETDTVTRLTKSPHNAFEGSYSPSGEKLAYVSQYENKLVPRIINLSDADREVVPPRHWKADTTTESLMTRPIVGSSAADTANWSAEPYRSNWKWIRPRTLLPVAEEVSNSDTWEIGLSFHSGDLLQSQSYQLDLTAVQDRHWYDFSYRDARFFPGYEIGISSRPSFQDFELPVDGNTVRRTMLRQQRNFSLNVPLRFELENNVFFSSLTLRPGIRLSQLRYFELSHTGDPASDFGNFAIGSLSATLNYRLQQNTRDLQPNSGVSIYGQMDHYFNSQNIFVGIDGQRFGLSFAEPTALRTGLFTYISPLRRLNQSMRIGLEFLTQSGPVFDNQSIISPAFPDPVMPLSSNLASFSTRYTVPLAYPDDGGLLIPLYLGNLYMVAFSDTVFDPMNGGLTSSKSVFGIGLRSHFRISNLNLDLGIGVGFEPSSERFRLIFGNF